MLYPRLRRTPIRSLALLLGLQLQAGIVLADQPPPPPPTQFTMIDLGMSTGATASQAVGLNNGGQVVVQATIEGKPHLLLWKDGALVDLGGESSATFGGQHSINDAGQVVGFSKTATGAERVFSWANGAMIDLGTLGGTQSHGAAINVSGQIVGDSLIQGDTATHAFLRATDGSLVDLGPYNGNNTYAMSINANGQVVGWYGNGQPNDSHAFLYSNSTITPLPCLGGDTACRTVPTSINNRGQIVGWLNNTQAPNAAGIAFLFDQNGIRDLGKLPEKQWCTARGLNDQGWIVGNCSADDVNNTMEAWFHNGTQLVNLNTLLPANSGWLLKSADAINDAGQIAGTGVINGQIHAFLMTPAAAPTTVALNVLKTGTGTGKVMGSDIDCGTDCAQDYASNTDVTLTAVADTGSTFAGWTGPCGNTGITGITCIVHMTAAQTVTAAFNLAGTTTYTVTATTGANGTITPVTQAIAANATAVLTVTPAAGYVATVTGCGGTLAGTVYTTAPVVADCAVNATFAPVTAQKTYTVTAKGTDGGIVAPASRKVKEGGKTIFAVIAKKGAVAEITTTCPGGKFNAPLYTVGPITADCAVNVTFNKEAKSYIVTPSAGPNGSITPALPQTVQGGATTSFTVTPNAGYTLAGVTGCGGTLVGNTYTTGAIKDNCKVSARFALPQYTVTATAGAGGKVKPAMQKVRQGAAARFELKPDRDYVAAATTTCAGGVLLRNVYTVGPITADCAVSVTFTATNVQTYTVTPTAGANGSITPATAQTVNARATTTFTVAPATGYVAQVTGCGGKLVGNIYTTGRIHENCAVNATFIALADTTHTVKVLADREKGTIAPASPFTVKHGTTTTFTITPKEGYTVTADGCGGTLVGNTYTTGAVNENCTVLVAFAAQQYTVTATGSVGGAISPASQKVKTGTKAVLRVMPNEGYSAAVTGCGGTLKGKTYTTGAITADCAVTATFTQQLDD